MLRKIWYVAAKDLLQLTKDRMGLIWLIALPLLLMAVLGSLLSGVSSTAASLTATLPVVTHDSGQGATALIDALRRTPSLKIQMRTDEVAVEKAVRDSDQVGVLIIPKGFTAALQSSRPSARVTYYAVAGNNDQRATVAGYSKVSYNASPGPA